VKKKTGSLWEVDEVHSTDFNEEDFPEQEGRKIIRSSFAENWVAFVVTWLGTSRFSNHIIVRLLCQVSTVLKAFQHFFLCQIH